MLFWIILCCVVLTALAALIGGPRRYPDKRTERIVQERQLRRGPSDYGGAGNSGFNGGN